jgi:hypothetical protein
LSSDQDTNYVESIINLCDVRYLLDVTLTKIPSSFSSSEHDFICRYKYDQKNSSASSAERSLIPLTEENLLETDRNKIILCPAPSSSSSSSSRKRALSTESQNPSRKSSRRISSDSSSSPNPPTPSPIPTSESSQEAKGTRRLSQKQRRRLSVPAPPVTEESHLLSLSDSSLQNEQEETKDAKEEEETEEKAKEEAKEKTKEEEEEEEAEKEEAGEEEEEEDSLSSDSSKSSLHDEFKYAEILTQMSAARVVHELQDILEGPPLIPSSQDTEYSSAPLTLPPLPHNSSFGGSVNDNGNSSGGNSRMSSRRRSSLYHELYGSEVMTRTGTGTNTGSTTGAGSGMSSTRNETQRSSSSTSSSSLSSSLSSSRRSSPRPTLRFPSRSFASSSSSAAAASADSSSASSSSRNHFVLTHLPSSSHPFLDNRPRKTTRVGHSYQADNIPELLPTAPHTISTETHSNPSHGRSQQIWNPNLCSPLFNHLQYLQRAASLTRRYCVDLLSQEVSDASPFSSSSCSTQQLLRHTQTDPTNTRNITSLLPIINGSYIPLSNSYEDIFLEALFLRSSRHS